MEISRFLGIIISFCQDFAAPAHVHITYNHYQCVMNVENGAVFNGTIPPRVAALAAEWVHINRGQLTQNWDLYKQGNINLTYIPPLVE